MKWRRRTKASPEVEVIAPEVRAMVHVESPTDCMAEDLAIFMKHGVVGFPDSARVGMTISIEDVGLHRCLSCRRCGAQIMAQVVGPDAVVKVTDKEPWMDIDLTACPRLNLASIAVVNSLERPV